MKGYTLIASAPCKADSMTRPGRIVLCDRGQDSGPGRYVVWYQWARKGEHVSHGDFDQGTYCGRLCDALDEFSRRASRQAEYFRQGPGILQAPAHDSDEYLVVNDWLRDSATTVTDLGYALALVDAVIRSPSDDALARIEELRKATL